MLIGDRNKAEMTGNCELENNGHEARPIMAIRQ